MSTSANRAPGPGAGVLAALCLLASCAVGPDFQHPPPPATEGYGVPAYGSLTADGAVQNIRLGASVDPAWWRLFGSPALSSIVETGLKDSPTLASARATLDQAQAQAQAGAGVFFPNASGSFAATREHVTAVPSGSGPGSSFSLYTLVGAVSYAVDIFGGERRSVEALNAQTDYQRNVLGAAWLTLSGNIVDSAIAHAGYAEEKSVLARIVGLDSAQRDIDTAQFKAGQASWSAVLQAEQQLGADREALAVVDERLSAAKTLLARLIGREPATAALPTPLLSELSVPQDAPVALPSQLIQKRPDILQSEAALHQATAQVGVATAALFPSISITGDYGATSTALANLAGPAGRFWSVGPSVDVPIFKGGALWYGRMAALAAQRTAESNYRQTVLIALEQVADQLKALDADAESSGAARAAFDAAEQAHNLANVNLKAGLVADYDVMTIAIVAERARLELIAARAQRLQDVVGLYLASGGGWNGHVDQFGSSGK